MRWRMSGLLGSSIVYCCSYDRVVVGYYNNIVVGLVIMMGACVTGDVMVGESLAESSQNYLVR